jgi:hypothetical protein
VLRDDGNSEQALVTKHMDLRTAMSRRQRCPKAARLETTERVGLQYTKSHAIALCFADMALLDETLTRTRPSLIAAASIVCTLRVLGCADWSKQLEHYTMLAR